MRETLPDMTGMKVAVTGATGLLGGYLVRALRERGARPIAIVRAASRTTPLMAAGVEVRHAELSDIEALAKAFEGADCVIGNAALVSLRPHPFSRYLETNVDGTIHVFKAMRSARVSRGIHISSVGIYLGHNPPVDENHPRYGEAHRQHRFNGYKVSKALAEETAWRYAAKYEMALTTLRPSVMYGAFDRNFGVWHRKAIRMRPFAFHPYLARFCLVYAGDVANAAMLCIENSDSHGKAYNVTGEDLRLREFTRAWCEEDPTAQEKRLPLPVYYRRHYASGRIRRELGWKTRSHRDGIRETLALEGDGG